LKGQAVFYVFLVVQILTVGSFMKRVNFMLSIAVVMYACLIDLSMFDL